MDPHDQDSNHLTDSWRAGCRDNWHVRFGRAALGNVPAKAVNAPSVDPNHATGCELVQFTPGGFGWSTPAGLQYLTRSGPPPLIQANELAGLPVPGKPANPDVALLHAAQRETVPVLASPADLSKPDEVIHEAPDPGG